VRPSTSNTASSTDRGRRRVLRVHRNDEHALGATLSEAAQDRRDRRFAVAHSQGDIDVDPAIAEVAAQQDACCFE